MEVVREAVDHRHGAVLRQVEDGLVGEGAGHDAVHVAGEDLGGIRDRLAAAELDVAARKEEGLTAHLRHAHLEAHPRAGGGLLEDHGERLPVHVVFVLLRMGLHVRGKAEETGDLLGRQVVDRDQMTGHGIS